MMSEVLWLGSWGRPPIADIITASTRGNALRELAGARVWEGRKVGRCGTQRGKSYYPPSPRNLC
jgi:hypothetical protein